MQGALKGPPSAMSLSLQAPLFSRVLPLCALLCGATACGAGERGEGDKPGVTTSTDEANINSGKENTGAERPKDEPKDNQDDVELPDADGGDPDEKPKSGGIDCDDHKHVACDEKSDDPFHAIGINCPGESPRIEASFRGSEKARGLRTSFGPSKAFDPREGSRYLVLGTGNINKLDTPENSFDDNVCSVDLGKKFDLKTLPAPINVKRVGEKTCAEDPSLVGKGDCSNSIEAQWNAAALPGQGVRSGAHDYSEMRLKMTVPVWAKSLSFDFAFMTVEYPEFLKMAYNDFFVVWLESKKWTGNISFDKNGKPISLNAGFFDFKDSSRPVPLDQECLLGCDAPELHETCLKEHASTKWLTTSVGVTPGEEIELIFAIVDLGDSSLDSFAFIDNFQWGCEEQDEPETNPPV